MRGAAGVAGAMSACGAPPGDPWPAGPAAVAREALPVRVAGAGAASLALSLHSDGWAMISDARPLGLAYGSQVARFAPVAATTDARGALLEAPGLVSGIRFRFDAESREKLLEAFDGKEVEVFSPEASPTVNGTLIMTPAGPVIWRQRPAW